MSVAKDVKSRLKKEKVNAERILRTIEELDFSALYTNSPVEVLRGIGVVDVQTFEYFVCFDLQNVSEKTIESLTIRLWLYERSNIPYIKYSFKYSASGFTLGCVDEEGEPKVLSRQVKPHEKFGKHIFVPLPQTYFKRLELELLSIKYVGEEEEKLEIMGKKARTIPVKPDADLIYIYDTLNEYKRIEEAFPFKNVPVLSENAWLCCCGTKNPIDYAECSRCKRDRDWQFENIALDALLDVKEDMRNKSDVTLKNIHKADIKPNITLESAEEIERKDKAVKRAILHVEEQEKKAEIKKAQILPRALLYFVIMYVLIAILQLLRTFGGGR